MYCYFHYGKHFVKTIFEAIYFFLAGTLIVYHDRKIAKIRFAELSAMFQMFVLRGHAYGERFSEMLVFTLFILKPYLFMTVEK